MVPTLNGNRKSNVISVSEIPIAGIELVLETKLE
jgi:hypothetical protein